MLKNRVQANTLEFDLEGTLERLQRFGRQQYLEVLVLYLKRPQAKGSS